jgi:glycosyltransferase involved in cell wall biosynthesis
LRIALNARFLIEGKMEGIGYSCWEIYRRMIELNPQHTFILFFDRPYSTVFTTFKNVIPVVMSPPARHPILWFIWFEWAVPKALKKWKADVFFSHDGFTSLRSTIPVFLTVHDLAFLAFPKQVPFLVYHFYRIFTPLYLKKANHIFTVSNFVKEDIQTKYGIHPSKISVIYNGSRNMMTNDLEPINHKIPSSSSYFFYYGAIHPRKNIENAIKAYNLFRAQNEGEILFLFAGRMAWSTGEVEKAWKESPYAEDIHFLGYLSDASIAHYLKHALALVYISLHEGFGMPIIEAFAAETPVITSNNGALSEISGQGALLVNPLDIHDIVRGMNEIHKNTSLRRSLTEAGKKELNRFNWDNSAQICSDIITQLAKDKPK